MASPEKKTYLGSAFRSINEDEMTSGGGTSSREAGERSGDGGETNYLLYIALGVALLVIGVLAGKLMGRKGKGDSSDSLASIINAIFTTRDVSGYMYIGRVLYLKYPLDLGKSLYLQQRRINNIDNPKRP
ncbi:MAG: hypothetical protein CMH46_14760 [Muricauda sp.]|nr:MULTISPECIES: hypothetical protein [unclassified Allomuricauda]MAU16787.1 hypothetical protein [Allomuricauda sp.]